MKTQTYFLGSEIVCKIWIHLYESGHEKLASSLSRSMIKQGCEELLGTNDGNVIYFIDSSSNKIIAYSNI